MNFIKLTKMDDNFNKNVLSPLAPHIGSLFSTYRAIEPTFPTNIRHNAPKSVNPHHSYVCRGRLKPVFQRTRTHLTNYIVSRVATARRKTRILPRSKDDVNSKSLKAWDDLVNYDFDIIRLAKKIPQWVKASTTFGNGIAMVSWMTDKSIDYDDPFFTICHLWDIMPAPETQDLEDDCPWLIRRILTTKEKIERDEKNRGKEFQLYKNVNFIEPQLVDDWKAELYDVNLKKMGQIQNVSARDGAEGATIKIGSEKFC